MQFLSAPSVPVVTSLPSPSKAGRLLSLLSDGRLYHDNGVSWDDLSVPAAPNVPWVRTGSNAVNYIGDGLSAALATENSSPLEVYYLPFSVPKVFALEQIGLHVVTGGAGTARVGIYANDGSGSTDVPGALLAEGANALDTSTSGEKLTGISITLYPGIIYWAASVWSAAISTYSVTINNGLWQVFGRVPASTLTPPKGYYEPVGSAVLPATASPLGLRTLGNPVVRLIG